MGRGSGGGEERRGVGGKTVGSSGGIGHRRYGKGCWEGWGLTLPF